MSVLTTKEIMDIIPHRHPFLLVDTIEELVPGVRAAGKKCVTYDEYYFRGKHGIKMVFFMLTNIIKESTELLCYGEGSDGLVYEAFGEKVEDSSCRLEGVVSRKKQLIPKFMNALQQ